MGLDRFQHQTHAPTFSPDTQECPFFATECTSQNSTQMDQVKLPFFSSIIWLLTSTTGVWQASFLIHRHHFPSIQVSTSAVSVGIIPYPSFSFLTLITRKEIQKTQHLLRFWHKLRGPVELRSSWHIFLAKTTELQPHHPKMHEGRLTMPEDSRNSLRRGTTDFIRMVQPVKKPL